MMQDILIGEGRRAKPAPISAILGDRYLPEQAISMSALSVVWRAKDLRDGSPVALKLFPRQFIEDQSDFAALNEIVAETQGVRHAGVVPADNVVVSEKYAAVVAPWIEGPTLRQMMAVRPSRFFEVATLRRWLLGLLDALEAAHLRGVTHGALNADVVLQRELEIQVVGFGVNAWLRRAAMRHSRRAARDQQRCYLSPAQRRGETPCPEDDIFALGALVYELLSGTPPQAGGSWRRHGLPITMAQQRRRTSGNAGDVIPVTWERAIAGCLEPRERNRIGTVRELRLTLDLVGSDSPASGAAPRRTARRIPEASVLPPPADAPPPREDSPAQEAPVTPSGRPVLPWEGPAAAAPRGARAVIAPDRGVFWLRAFLATTALATIAIGAGIGWKLYERHEAYRSLLADVRAFPAGAGADERESLEARLIAARPELTSRQWSDIRTAWRRTKAASPADATPTPTAASTMDTATTGDLPRANGGLQEEPVEPPPFLTEDLWPRDSGAEDASPVGGSDAVAFAGSQGGEPAERSELATVERWPPQPAETSEIESSQSSEVELAGTLEISPLRNPEAEPLETPLVEARDPSDLVASESPDVASAAIPETASTGPYRAQSVESPEGTDLTPMVTPVDPNTGIPTPPLDVTSTGPGPAEPQPTGRAEPPAQPSPSIETDSVAAVPPSLPPLEGVSVATSQALLPVGAATSEPVTIDAEVSEVETAEERATEMTEAPAITPFAIPEATPTETAEVASAADGLTEPAVTSEIDAVEDHAFDLTATPGTAPTGISESIHVGPPLTIPAQTPEIASADEVEPAATDASEEISVDAPETAPIGTDKVGSGEPPEVANFVPALPPVIPEVALPAPPAEPPSGEPTATDLEAVDVAPVSERAIVPEPEGEAAVVATEPLVRETRIFEVSDVDVAPQLIHQVEPQLPRRWGREARIDLIVVIDRNGRVASTAVSSATRRSFVDPVRRAVHQWRFTPATKNGQAVSVRMSLPLAIPAS